MGVEATGDQDQVRSKGDRGRYDQALHHADVLDIATARRHRDVQRGSASRPPTDLAEIACPGIEGKLVGGDVEDRRVVLEAVLGAVAVVHVPIEDQDACRAVLRLQGAGGERDVVEEAESHGVAGLGVMARWAHRSQSRRRLPPQHASREIDRAARGQTGHFVAARTVIGVPVELAGRGVTGRGESIQQRPFVDAQDLFGLGRPRCGDLDPISIGVQRFSDRNQALRSFGMTFRAPMALIADILHDLDVLSAAGRHRRRH